MRLGSTRRPNSTAFNTSAAGLPSSEHQEPPRNPRIQSPGSLGPPVGAAEELELRAPTPGAGWEGAGFGGTFQRASPG